MLLFVTALHLLPAASAEPRLSGPEGALAVGVAASFSFTTDAPGAYVDGCAAVELERREGETWVPVSDMASCDGSTEARAVDGRLTISLATPGAGEYRGAVTWGTGCVSGRPFALAACTATKTARSAPFTVAPASDSPQP